MKGTPLSPVRGLLLSLAFVALASSAGLAAGAPVPITAVQVDETGDLIRLVAQGDPAIALSSLSNPSRSVIDLTPARLSIRGTASVNLPVSSAIIDQVRVGQWRPDTVRVVIDHPSNYSLTLPSVTSDGEQIAISFRGDTVTDADIATIRSLPVPALPEAAQPASNLIGSTVNSVQLTADVTVLNDLPVSVDGDLNASVVLFKFPEVPSYTVWLERFPNRLVFETPARPEGVAATSLDYQISEVALYDQAMVKDVRIYKSTDGVYTKAVCYLTSYASWSDELVPGGVQVSIASAISPAASGQKDVEFSAKNWIAPGTEFQAESTNPIAVRDQAHEAAMESDAAAAGNTTGDPGIRITTIETDGAEVENPVESLRSMGGAVGGLTNDNANSMGGSNAPAANPGPHTVLPPDRPEIAPMSETTAPDLYLFKGESVILPVSRLMRTSVGDPEVLAPTVLSQAELLITAKAEGRTSLITWEEGKGRTIRTVDVAVSTDGRASELAQVLNDSGVKVSFVGGKTVVLEGKVRTEADKNRAELIAKGSAENVVDLIEIDSPSQVLVKVRMVELNNRDKEQLYKQLGTGSQLESGDFSFNVLGDILNPEAPGGGLFNISLRPGIVNRDQLGDASFDPLDLMLNALETERRARVLSQPNIVTMSGHEAKFRVGGEVPFTFKNENGFNVVNFREFGIELTVTPTVDSMGNILCALNPTVRTVDNSLAVSGIPGFRTRTVTTNVQIQNGRTLVIGGLIQREVSESKAAIPILSDIHLIGQLFKSKQSLDDETELLIFLTPILVEEPTEVQGDIYNEDDVAAGGVDDDRYTFYGEGPQQHIDNNEE
ncbi:MAG: pilus assembly protein N-terminal domain-containing protein [bacterium]